MIGRCLLLAILLTLGARAYALPEFAEVRNAWQSSYGRLLDREGRTIALRRLDFQALRLEWVALDDVSPAVLDVLMEVEDQRFAYHRGVDWLALARAAWHNLCDRGRRGASTLSMQVVKLLGRARARGMLGKLGELRAALALEARWTKTQILEAYLNLVPFRGELIGIAGASQALFNKAPSGLDRAEALILATLISTPNARPARVAARACELAGAHRFDLDCAQLSRRIARALAPRGDPIAPVALAPQLATRLVQRPGQIRRTGLSATLQARVRAILDEQLAALSAHNVRDAAAVVLDNTSGEVLAYVGGAGMHSRAAAVDGVRARRQAGSTLKPFLYGLAFDARYLTPASLLDDAPLQLETVRGLYIPQNYDRAFKGVVSARTALASSLNIPAVRSLVLVGVEALRERLFAFGFEGIREDGAYYGYSLALGSAEVNLLELANAYRALANGGRWTPVRFERARGKGSARRVVSPAAAFLVLDILADPAARALTFGLDSALALPFWSAVKTGTSKDMRDNWCVGVSAHYTVAVWVGNFEGDAMREVSGVSGAAPAWAAILRALHAARPSPAPQPPPGVVARDVVFEPPFEAPRREWFIAGTEQDTIALVPPARRPPRIASPPNGVVIALDPDIPAAHQRVVIAARGAPDTARYYLNGRFLAAAQAALAWFPEPGYHRLELRYRERVLDTVRFSVRAPR
jgi:penicillin-binding protein 1C